MEQDDINQDLLKVRQWINDQDIDKKEQKQRNYFKAGKFPVSLQKLKLREAQNQVLESNLSGNLNLRILNNSLKQLEDLGIPKISNFHEFRQKQGNLNIRYVSESKQKNQQKNKKLGNLQFLFCPINEDSIGSDKVIYQVSGANNNNQQQKQKIINTKQQIIHETSTGFQQKIKRQQQLMRLSGLNNINQGQQQNSQSQEYQQINFRSEVSPERLPRESQNKYNLTKLFRSDSVESQNFFQMQSNYQKTEKRILSGEKKSQNLKEMEEWKLREQRNFILNQMAKSQNQQNWNIQKKALQGIKRVQRKLQNSYHNSIDFCEPRYNNNNQIINNFSWNLNQIQMQQETNQNLTNDNQTLSSLHVKSLKQVQEKEIGDQIIDNNQKKQYFKTIATEIPQMVTIHKKPQTQNTKNQKIEMHRKITNHKTENFNKRENFSKEMERQLKELKISNQSWNFNKIKLHSNKKSREDSKNTTQADFTNLKNYFVSKYEPENQEELRSFPYENKTNSVIVDIKDIVNFNSKGIQEKNYGGNIRISNINYIDQIKNDNILFINKMISDNKDQIQKSNKTNEIQINQTQNQNELVTNINKIESENKNSQQIEISNLNKFRQHSKTAFQKFVENEQELQQNQHNQIKVNNNLNSYGKNQIQQNFSQLQNLRTESINSWRNSINDTPIN